MSITISLDARLSSCLDWSKQKQEALLAMDQGYCIFWKLDLGLFDHLNSSLADTQQFYSLGISIDHFKEFVAHFLSSSSGVLLYEGDWNFLKSASHSFSELLQNRNVALDYIKSLASGLPEELPCYLKICYPRCSLSEYLYFFSKEAFEGFHLLLEGEFKNYFAMEAPRLGIVLPSLDKILHFEQLIQQLHLQSIPFKVIPELLITQEWDGLDYLLIFSDSISFQGKRKLNGFLAAGGSIITVGNLLGCAEEIAYNDFINQKN